MLSKFMPDTGPTYVPPGVEGVPLRQETATTEKKSDVSELQEKFEETRMDADGIRDVLVIGNERRGGCPFKCQGCGVQGEAVQVDTGANAQIISEQIDEMRRKLESNPTEYQEHGYHLCIYNNGNVTNPKELSAENLTLLLYRINELVPPPKYVSLNSRGPFINEKGLQDLQNLGLKYDIHFILGVETFTEKGMEIYGKRGIGEETERMFTTINEFNKANGTRFGMDVGFVFLPEFYADDREDKPAIEQGFLDDVEGFTEKYVGRETPIMINVHPFYPMPNLPWKSTASCFDTLMEAVIKFESEVQARNASLPEYLRASVFIGLNDSGYETPEWLAARSKWQADIDRINRGLK